MIDTHCHLTHRRFDGDVDEVLARARDTGVTCCITIGTGPEDARRGLALARRHSGSVECTAGLDPFSAHAAGEGFDDAFVELERLLRAGGFRAVGEIGLDYHYDLDPRPVQAERLVRQLSLAEDLDLPVVIHVREAHDDMVSILAAHPRNRGVIHSFTAGPAEAERYLELGWYLAFNGVLTFPGAESVREAARIVSDERLLVETDAPYLAPVPRRGKRCEPADAARTLAVLAEVRDVPVEQLDARTTANARGLFGL